MKINKYLHLTFAAVGLITVIIGFPGCAFLNPPVDTSSVMPSPSTQHVSYHQPSDQPGAQHSNDQNKLGVAQTNEDTSLQRDPNPGWGPVNFLGSGF
jgi:hypothetical protein